MLTRFGAFGRLAAAIVAVAGLVVGLVLGNAIMLLGGVCMLIGIFAVLWGESLGVDR